MNLKEKSKMRSWDSKIPLKRYQVRIFKIFAKIDRLKNFPVPLSILYVSFNTERQFAPLDDLTRRYYGHKVAKLYIYKAQKREAK